jgi:uncharacterized NAD(P)/FAD-binding protein YdhS
MFRRVAIIGGGAAAAALLGELLGRTGAPPLRLDWYTGDAQPAPRGIAYGTSSPHHLLNVRAAQMGLLIASPDGFLSYAQHLDPRVGGHDFLPRKHYGDFLEHELGQRLAEARAAGWDIRQIPFAVDAMVPAADGIDIIQGEQDSHVDATVLAIGSLPPRPLAGVGAAALASGRYVTDPWAYLAHDTSEPEVRHIALIGAGLSAVDAVLALSARWPQARFTTISRHGLFPEIHRRVPSPPDLDSGTLVEAMQDAPYVQAWMRLLREAIAASSDWRSVIDSLRPHTPALWAQLSLEQRARFLRHARWAWERARHRMAPQVGESLAALEKNGRLRRRRGRMVSVDVAGAGLDLHLLHAGEPRRETLSVGQVIQTVGLDMDVQRTTHPLIRQLLTNRHIVADPLGQGVLAETDGRLRHADGSWPHLFAIGGLLRGTLWESVAMPEIRQQARALATRILAG